MIVAGKTNGRERDAFPLLILFARTPVPGRVKTRIAAVVGQEQASRIYGEMLGKALELCRPGQGWRRIVAIPGDSDAAYFERRGFPIIRQEGEDIGQRMANALLAGLDSGAGQVVIIGSDIPTLTQEEIKFAFIRLNSVPAVIGPSRDGGFYLIGIGREHRDAAERVLKDRVNWSTPAVLAEVRDLCRKHGLLFELLPLKSDVDTIEDWLDYQSARDGEDS